MRRIVVTSIVLVAMALVALSAPASSEGGAGSGGCGGSAGSGVHRAGLVVSFGNEAPTQRFCIEFTEESISGIELLERSGLSLVTQAAGGLGSGVCAIDGVGSDDPTNCFKYSTTPPYRFWVYFRWTVSGWQFSNVGASTRVIRDGEIDGWSWGNGASAQPEAPEGVLDPPPTSTRIPATSTPTPRIEDTATARPESTAEPSETPAQPEAAVPTSAPAAVPSPGAAGTQATAPAAGVASPVVVASPAAGVAGSLATPLADATPVPATPAETTTRTAVPSRTAAAGVIVVDATQAWDNAATAEQVDGDSGGGGFWGLVGFGAVAMILAGGAGLMLYQRRGTDA